MSLYQEEAALYAKAPPAQLRAVIKALSLHSWGNSPRERARLAACKDLMRDKGGRS